MKVKLTAKLKRELCNISPMWKQRIIDEEMELLTKPHEAKMGNSFYRLDIGDSSSCIVGEAWNFNTDYGEEFMSGNYNYEYDDYDNDRGCSDCIFYADALMYRLDPEKFTYSIHDLDQSKTFEDYLAEFVEHFKNDHEEIYKIKVKHNKPKSKKMNKK